MSCEWSFQLERIAQDEVRSRVSMPALARGNDGSIFGEHAHSGLLSSEWEGRFFCDDPGLGKLEVHHRLCSRFLGQI